MGILRFYLALCVIAEHSNSVLPWLVHDGLESVEIFFMISGFYMAMILPKYSNVMEFYFNRFLRIFIPYFLICGMILTLSLIFGIVWGEWLELEPFINFSVAKNSLYATFLMIFATFSNLTIFFQDLVFILSYDLPSALNFSIDLSEGQYPFYKYLLDPPAWSISVELIFYFFAPVIVKFTNKKLLLILLSSLTIRIFFYEMIGVKYNGWIHKFFVCAIALFVMGIFSFRLYSNWLINLTKKLPINLQISNKYYIFYCGFILLFFFLTKFATQQLGSIIKMNYAYLISYLIWMAIIPILFQLTANNKLDRYIGNLSYPIYLIHTIVIKISQIIIPYCSISESWLGKISALITILASVVIIHFFVNPLEKQRYVLAKTLSNNKWSK
jgi:peptidoglycan/LPS O-acetylase OafA/YrhL